MYVWTCYSASVISQKYIMYNWYIAQNVYPTFSMSVLLRRSFKTDVSIATSKFMNEFYYVRFGAELSVLMLERTIVLALDYISETRKWKAQLLGTFLWKRNMKSLSNETLNIFFRKFWACYILDFVKTVWVLRILSQIFTRHFVIKEL